MPPLIRTTARTTLHPSLSRIAMSSSVRIAGALSTPDAGRRPEPT
ncbi:hypothetical protein [Streptomyces sp. NPDC051452]